MDWSNQNFSPFDCKIIAADFGFRRFIAVLKSLTVDSTRNKYNPKTYTLTVGEEIIDVSQTVSKLTSAGPRFLELKSMAGSPTVSV